MPPLHTKTQDCVSFKIREHKNTSPYGFWKFGRLFVEMPKMNYSQISCKGGGHILWNSTDDTQTIERFKNAKRSLPKQHADQQVKWILHKELFSQAGRESPSQLRIELDF